MQDTHIFFAALQHAGGKDAAVFDAFIFHLIRETLTLYSGHVDDISGGDDVFQVGVLVVFQAGILDAHLNRRREFQFDRADEMECGVEVAHGLHQRVHGAAILQVAHHRNLQVVEGTLCFAYAIEVEHALGGMLVGTIACIDDRHRSHFGCIAGRALLGVAHDNQVRIGGYHHDGVVQRLSFLHTGATRVGEADDAGAKLVGCAFETQACTRGRLEEERCDHLVAEDFLFWILLKSFGNIQHLDILFFAEVGDGDEAASFNCTHDGNYIF